MLQLVRSEDYFGEDDTGTQMLTALPILFEQLLHGVLYEAQHSLNEEETRTQCENRERKKPYRSDEACARCERLE